MKLYLQFIIWFILNIFVLANVLLAALFWGLFGSDNLFSSMMFSRHINEIISVASINMQYKHYWQWPGILDKLSEEFGIRLAVCALDEEYEIPMHMPERLKRTGRKIPRALVISCGPEDKMDMAESGSSGFLPAQNCVYLKDNGLYWYARPGFIPDMDGNQRYVLIGASSPSISGNGLFFDVDNLMLSSGLLLFISLIWWWPFVVRITSPLAMITRAARSIASGNYIPQSADGTYTRFALTRNDEIGQLSKAIENMANQLMQQMNGQRRFIRHISHELGAPIARAQFGVAVLENIADGPAQKRAREVARDIDQLSVLVEDLLTFLRSEMQSDALKFECFSLSRLLEELVLTERGNTDAELRPHLPDADVTVYTDQKCILRATGNVLRNAIYYAGGDGPVDITLESREGSAVICVEDCGPGVSEEELPHLTEVFFRGARSPEHRGGSGLGLAIALHCLKLCNGELRIENRTPRGLRVRLSFPLQHDAKGAV